MIALGCVIALGCGDKPNQAAGTGSSGSPKDCVALWNREASLELRRQFNEGLLVGQRPLPGGGAPPASVSVLALTYKGDPVRDAALGSADDPDLDNVTVRPGDCLIVLPGTVIFARARQGWIPSASVGTRETRAIAPGDASSKFVDESARRNEDGESNAVALALPPDGQQDQTPSIGKLRSTGPVPSPSNTDPVGTANTDGTPPDDVDGDGFVDPAEKRRSAEEDSGSSNDRLGAAGSGLVGTWSGQITQTRPSGRTDRLTQTITIGRAGGSLGGSSHGSFSDGATPCGGRLVSESGDDQTHTFSYYEERSPSDCIHKTRVTLKVVGDGELHYRETYETDSGRGTVRGLLTTR